jgi:tellurite resistance protein
MSDLDHAKKELSDELGSPKVEALIEAMFLAATADGEFAPEESMQFSATIGALTDRTLDPDGVFRLVGLLSEKLRNEGRQARLSAVAQRLPEGKPRETALILAAAITMSDGDVKSTENDFIADLAEALGVEQGRAVELVQKVQRSR